MAAAALDAAAHRGGKRVVPTAYNVKMNRKAPLDAAKSGGKRPFKWMMRMARSARVELSVLTYQSPRTEVASRSSASSR